MAVIALARQSYRPCSTRYRVMESDTACPFSDPRCCETTVLEQRVFKMRRCATVLGELSRIESVYRARSKRDKRVHPFAHLGKFATEQIRRYDACRTSVVQLSRFEPWARRNRAPADPNQRPGHEKKIMQRRKRRRTSLLTLIQAEEGVGPERQRLLVASHQHETPKTGDGGNIPLEGAAHAPPDGADLPGASPPGLQPDGAVVSSPSLLAFFAPGAGVDEDGS
jgi:hypothetical protein